MNISLFNIIKQIVAQYGESILADSARLKPVFADYAKNEQKEDRVAFGRCIEMGAYHELKKTRSVDERRRVKAALADQVNAKTGVDRARCGDALDLLEAVMFTPIRQTSPTPPQVNTPVYVQTGKVKSSKVKKNTMVVLIAALGLVLILIYFSGQRKNPAQPIVHHTYVKEDGSPDWDSFFSAVKSSAVNYNYIFVKKESTDVYEEHPLNSVGNTFYYYDNGTNYQIILRNNDPNYFGTVRRFNGSQADAAISYFNEQLPNILKDIFQWLLDSF